MATREQLEKEKQQQQIAGGRQQQGPNTGSSQQGIQVDTKQKAAAPEPRQSGRQAFANRGREAASRGFSSTLPETPIRERQERIQTIPSSDVTPQPQQSVQQEPVEEIPLPWNTIGLNEIPNVEAPKPAGLNVSPVVSQAAEEVPLPWNTVGLEETSKPELKPEYTNQLEEAEQQVPTQRQFQEKEPLPRGQNRPGKESSTNELPETLEEFEKARKSSRRRPWNARQRQANIRQRRANTTWLQNLLGQGKAQEEEVVEQSQPTEQPQQQETKSASQPQQESNLEGKSEGKIFLETMIGMGFDYWDYAENDEIRRAVDEEVAKRINAKSEIEPEVIPEAKPKAKSKAKSKKKDKATTMLATVPQQASKEFDESDISKLNDILNQITKSEERDVTTDDVYMTMMDVIHDENLDEWDLDDPDIWNLVTEETRKRLDELSNKRRDTREASEFVKEFVNENDAKQIMNDVLRENNMTLEEAMKTGYIDLVTEEAGKRLLELAKTRRNDIGSTQEPYRRTALNASDVMLLNQADDESYYDPDHRLQYNIESSDAILDSLREDTIKKQKEDDSKRNINEKWAKYEQQRDERKETYRASDTYDDTIYNANSGVDVTGLENDPIAMAKKIVYESFEQVKDLYEGTMEKPAGVGLTIDEYENGERYIEWIPEERVPKFLDRLRGVRNLMRMMFFNPAMLHIEGESIETSVEYETVGNKKVRKVYARRIYNKDGNDDVDHAIVAVRNLYGCTTRSVMRLVILRAGLGISVDGKIANKNPNDFKLSREQFIELCRDIIASQEKYGHPFALVQGTPGGVRDDSGMFVVVGGTRCFPMGYMPLELMHSLKANMRSDLHYMSDREIQERISESWLNDTYPQLCANTRGNLMWQARAIENMMQALMSIDGSNPVKLNIPMPEDMIRQDRLMLETEAAIRTYGDIEVANKEKKKRYDKLAARLRARFMKPMGSKASRKDMNPGELQSDNMKRRQGWIQDWVGNLCLLQRASQAANIAVMITSIPEALAADMTQRIGYFAMEGMLRRVKPEVMKNYELTPDLERMSRSREAIEALQVSEALYRIGGHDMIDVFLNEKRDTDGRAMNKLTRTDLREFLKRWGVTAENQLSDRLAQALKVPPNQEAGFRSNLNRAMELLDAFTAGANLSQTNQTVQFVRMSMTEFALAASVKSDQRLSFTSDQIQQLGEGKSGAEEMIRFLMGTDAGREAFMTQGVTGLGRKSPYEHAMRRILSYNRVTEFAVRSMFDRFPEYGVNKVMNMVPYSNTMCYLASRGISSLGDLIQQYDEDSAIGGAMSRVINYQVGGRMGFAEGLLKNIMYDTIMGLSRLMIGGIYAGVIMQVYGGILPPEDKKNLYVWSEWRIGTEEQSVPIKWAWFMDDLSGVGLPLGTAWAICLKNDFGSDTTRIAANVFIDAIASLNSGTAIMDAIDLVNNFDEEWYKFNKHGYDVSYTEWGLTTAEQAFWDILGDATPAFVRQLVPWSKDYLFKRGDAHAFDKIYDTGERYTLDEAKGELHLRRPDNYQDYMRRRAAQSNVLMAFFYDIWNPETSYKYGEMPVDTMVDQYTMQYWNKHYLDLDDASSIPYDDPEERMRELDSRAEEAIRDLDQFATAQEARMSGFILNPDARENCMRYCYRRMDDAREEMREALSHGRLPTNEYNAVMENYYSKRNRYKSIVDDFLMSKEIPWALPRYVRQEGDIETRYVDENGNPMTYLDSIKNDTMRGFLTGVMGGFTDLAGLGRVESTGGAEEQQYLYGNIPGGLMPITVPEESGAYNYETPAWWTELGDDGKPLINQYGHPVLDENGNPVMGNEAADRIAATNRGMFDRAGEMGPVSNYAGNYSGMDVQEMYWGGQGNNMYDGTSEDLMISPTGTPTINTRGYRFMDEIWPDELTQLRDELEAAQENGEGGTSDDTEDDDNWGKKTYPNWYNSKRYPSSYSRKPYSSYTRSNSANYNPKIYSTSRDVSGGRAASIDIKSPYKASTTYLHPSFYTKGSSEAYKRSDI